MSAKKSKNKVAMAVTIRGGYVVSELFTQWMRLLRMHWFPGPVKFEVGIYPEDARNYATRWYLQSKEAAGCDYLLFWDDDNVPPEETIEIAQSEDAAVSGGLYYTRRYREPVPVAYFWQDGRARNLTAEELVPHLDERKKIRVDAVGTGTMLIRRDVLERLSGDKGAPHRVWETPKSDNGFVWSEDLVFCREAAERGFEIWLDTRRESGHVANHVVDSRDYVRSQADLARYNLEPTPLEPG